MKSDEDLIPTRQSLLSRLKDWADQASWRDFFETYWRLIYHTARKAGLNDAEAQDVVQETLISLMKTLPRFRYDPAQGSFKHWLLKLTRWRIKRQLGKRVPGSDQADTRTDTSTGTATIERVADPCPANLEAIWEEEWEHNLLDAATDRVKRKVDSKQYQIFDLYVFKQWPVARVARALQVSQAQVYLAKHRVNRLFKQELDYLKAKPL